MPSLIENIRGKIGAKPPSPAEIAKDRDSAQGELIALNAQAQALADAGDRAGWQALQAKITELHDQVKFHNDRIAGAVERERAEMIASHAHVRKLQITNCTKACNVVRTEADALAASIADAVKHYQNLMRAAQKAIDATPFGTKVPDDLLAPGKLRSDVMAEMFRLGVAATGPSIGRSTLMLLPGSASPDVMADDNPEAIPPFAAKVREQIDAMLSAIDAPAQ